ncbi:MAG TPA: OmpA family protein [Polyangiaceae bacterium]|nr:OmpA family protein [Polyangiaceae bacterium]
MRLDHSPFILAGAVALANGVSAAPAAAQQAAAGGAASAEASGVVTTGSDDDDSLAPRGNLWELGIFGGLIFISNQNALHEPELPYANFKKPTPEVGLRLAYLPLSFLGVEGEFMGAAGELEGGEGAVVWAGRGHLLFQVPTKWVIPFGLIGGGRMGIQSDTAGNDNDPELHFGGGLKINLDRRVLLRVEARDNITKQRPDADTAHHIEALVGVSLVFGRPEPRPKDQDADGVVDAQDACPLELGLPPDGCPVRDRDGDTIPDAQDQCPLEAGVAPTGCPVHDLDHDGVPDATDECRELPGIAPTGCPDKDGDGVLDRDDQCADVPGLAPHGCPPDSDGDGFVDNQDKCPNEAETKNGFEDDDGCPDELPDSVRKFTGVIQGIEFETGKAAVRATSAPVLEDASSVLRKYPSLKVMIVGHTDNVGSRDANVELSRRRAESVKAYLIKQGVAPERVETRGEGPDAPIASNSTKAGRQANRRIEFQIIK